MSGKTGLERQHTAPVAGTVRRAEQQGPEELVGLVELKAKKAKGSVRRTASLSGPSATQDAISSLPERSHSDQGPGAAEGVKLTMEQAKAKWKDMSVQLNGLINEQVEEISAKDEFVGIIGGPLEAKATAAEQMVAAKVLGLSKEKVDDVVVQARTIVASMIAGLIAYSNHVGVLNPAVDTAAILAGVGVEAVAGFTSAISQVALGLLHMPSPLMTMVRAAIPIGGFLCNPNVLALLPILFLGYSLSGQDARQTFTDVLGTGRDAIVGQLAETYKVSEEVALEIFTNAEKVIKGASDTTISMIQAASSVYLKMFASACSVVKGMNSVVEAAGSAHQNIKSALVSLSKSAKSGMNLATAGVGSFAERIRLATIRAAEGVTCQQGPGAGHGNSTGGRKTRKRVGRRRHRQRGKRGASTRKGKGKGRGKDKGRGHRGSTRKGKGKAKGRGKAKGKGLGSSTRRRHSRKH